MLMGCHLPYVNIMNSPVKDDKFLNLSKSEKKSLFLFFPEIAYILAYENIIN